MGILEITKNGNSRRNFLTGIIPLSCCLLSYKAWSITGVDGDELEHKFDASMAKPITHRQNALLRYGEFIKTMKAISGEWGEENVQEFLRKKGEESGVRWGKQLLKNANDDSLASFIKFLEDPIISNTLTFEYIEKTDTVCEIRVTECLLAEVFKSRNAGHIGYSYVCFGDYSACKSFNSKIKMERDKTLMQGHECCNHRYVFGI